MRREILSPMILARMFTCSPLVEGTKSHRSWPRQVEEAAGLGGGNDPLYRSDRPSWSCLCHRVHLLHEAHALQPSVQQGCWAGGPSRCGRGQHGSLSWGSDADLDRDPWERQQLEEGKENKTKHQCRSHSADFLQLVFSRRTQYKMMCGEGTK